MCSIRRLMMSVLLRNKEKQKVPKRAERVILFEDEKTLITFWRFPPGTETGWHRHTHDYVTLQQSNGKLKLENRAGNIKIIDYKDGYAAGYSAPVEHNATNVGDEEIRVTEIEYKV